MRMKFAIGIYLVAGAVEIGLGATYFSSREFMSYHAEAVGASWQELDVGVRYAYSIPYLDISGARNPSSRLVRNWPAAGRSDMSHDFG